MYQLNILVQCCIDIAWAQTVSPTLGEDDMRRELMASDCRLGDICLVNVEISGHLALGPSQPSQVDIDR